MVHSCGQGRRRYNPKLAFLQLIGLHRESQEVSKANFLRNFPMDNYVEKHLLKIVVTKVVLVAFF